MTTAVAVDNDNEEERDPLDTSTSAPLDERILDVVRNAKNKSDDGAIIVRPALLASELGLSVEDASRELCGLLSAVGGGEGGASFAFEILQMPTTSAGERTGTDGAAAAASAATTTMVFSFPDDFDTRARRYRRKSEWKEKLRAMSVALVKAIKIFTAFGLIISLAVLIVAGICLLVAAVIALARGGQGAGGGGHRNHPLMHRLRYLFFQLRQILWLYAICGSAVDGQQDPFMREIAGDLAFMMSICCGNPMHPFFWFRVGGMRQRWARMRRSRGWGGTSSWNDWNVGGNNNDGIAMAQRGMWGDHDDGSQRNRRSNPLSSSNISNEQQQRGLLSIAVEFLFGPSEFPGDNSNSPSVKELEKWKFRASVIMTLSSISQGNGVSLCDLLPYVDNPPTSSNDPSAIRETLRVVTYFNGRPVELSSGNGDGHYSGMDARFCFPEIVAEMDYQKLLTLGSSKFAPPAFDGNSGSSNISSILYKEEDGYDFGSSSNASSEIPEYFYEQPFVLTELTRQQFGHCALLGLLNFVGIIWVQSALGPGGLLELPVAAAIARPGRRSGSGPLVAFASLLLLKLLKILRFYAGLFFVLPLCRLLIVLARNFGMDRRNRRRKNYVRAEL